MPGRYLENHSTPQVLEAQERYYGRSREVGKQPERDLLTEEEVAFVAQRDSFYMATIASNGWPYIQPRGGPRGFLKVIQPSVLAFADYGGNRQLLSTGNLSGSDRVALFLMDYPRRERLKIMGHARVLDAREDQNLATQVAGSSSLRTPDLVEFGWTGSAQKLAADRFPDKWSPWP